MIHDEQEIRQLVATWAEAAKRGDIETVLNLMAEDVVFLAPGQPPMRGRAAFDAAMKAMTSESPPQFEVTSEIQEIQILGEWAYLWNRQKVVITPSDESPAMTRAGHTLSVLRKQSGQWMMARDANMLVTVQKPGR
ncbi:MAG: SgcJ/EcaC family oxidoreductase [Methylococcaceae bacterium]|nr:SgcJ/EcaC family oxidoreductase [Methylococcaceae bacterium]